MWELPSFSEAAKAVALAIEMLCLDHRFRRHASSHTRTHFKRLYAVKMWELPSFSEAAKAVALAIEMLCLNHRFRRQASSHILTAFQAGVRGENVGAVEL